MAKLLGLKHFLTIDTYILRIFNVKFFVTCFEQSIKQVCTGIIWDALKGLKSGYLECPFGTHNAVFLSKSERCLTLYISETIEDKKLIFLQPIFTFNKIILLNFQVLLFISFWDIKCQKMPFLAKMQNNKYFWLLNFVTLFNALYLWNYWR